MREREREDEREKEEAERWIMSRRPPFLAGYELEEARSELSLDLARRCILRESRMSQ